MQTHRLVAHTTLPAERVSAVTIRWGRVSDDRVMLRYKVDGCENVITPDSAAPAPADMRADELWKSTCFELFLADEKGCYREYNFSPSGQWALYQFSGYRSRVSDPDPVTSPQIETDRGSSVLTMTVFLSAQELIGAKCASLTTVIEEQRGRFSYWAARHANEKPDFHNPSCFVLPVP